MIDENSPFRSPFSIREPLSLAFKRKSQILSVFVVTFALVALASYVVPRVYEASAAVYVERNVPPFAMGNGRGFYSVLDRREVLNSEVEFITSRAVAERVADELFSPESQASSSALRAVREAIRGGFRTLGLLDPVGDRREDTIRFVQRNLIAKPALQSNVITISFRDDDPVFAADVVNAATQAYLEERLQLMKRPGLDEFYAEHIDRTRSALEELEQHTRTIKETTGVFSPEAELRLKLEELSNLNRQLSAVRSEMSELREKTAALRAQMTGEPETVTASRTVQFNPAVRELERKRLDLEAQKAMELNRFPEDSPPIQDLEHGIERLRENIAEEPSMVVDNESVMGNSVLTGLRTALYAAEAEISAKDAREATLLGQIDSLERELRSLDVNAMDLNRLSGSIDSAERIYYNYIEQREEARIEENTDPGTTNVRLFHDAVAPGKPLYSRLQLIVLGAMVGLMLGLLVAFVREFFDHSLSTRQDVERHLELPLLASLPDSEAAARPFS